MHSRFRPPTPLVALIADQAGVITTAQARSFGVSPGVLDRLSRNGDWASLGRGLWCTTPTPSWEALAWGGVLLGGDGAVLGGAAAGHLWGLVDQPRRIEVWTATQRRPVRGPWRFRHGLRSGRGSPSRISIEAAAVGLCGTAAPDEVVRVLGAAIGTRRTTTERLRQHVERDRSAQNRRFLQEVLADCAVGVESALERRFLHDVLRAHGLPVGRRQVSVSEGTRSDVVWDAYRLIVELDGRLHHEGLAAIADMGRDNLHALVGWCTVRYGWHPVVGSRCLAAAQVATGLTLGGWPGTLRRCAECPAS